MSAYEHAFNISFQGTDIFIAESDWISTTYWRIIVNIEKLFLEKAAVVKAYVRQYNCK